MAVISDQNPVKKDFLLPGDIISLISSMLSLPLIAIFFYQRWQWQLHRPITTADRWTVATVTLLLSYLTSFFYVFILTVLLHIRPGQNAGLCDATILLCLTLYVFSKCASILFLIERAYIITWPVNPRWKNREYILTCLGIYVPYAIVAALSMRYRVSMYVGKDVCVIGIQIYALIPLLIVEVLSYLYLTLRFLYPLITVHFGGTGLLLPLRRVVRRTCIGTAITMLSVLTVKVSLLMFNGEPAWLCCMTCKIDAVIACICLHWITKPETESNEDHNHNHEPELGVGFDDEDKQTTLVQQSERSQSVTLPASSDNSAMKESL